MRALVSRVLDALAWRYLDEDGPWSYTYNRRTGQVKAFWRPGRGHKPLNEAFLTDGSVVIGPQKTYVWRSK